MDLRPRLRGTSATEAQRHHLDVGANAQLYTEQSQFDHGGLSGFPQTSAVEGIPTSWIQELWKIFGRY
jgi:hypothetical protein